jgi:type VI secretion system protein ImpL
MLWIGGALASATTVALLTLLGVSLAVSILALLTVLLVVVIFILLRQLRQAKSAREIEDTISRQADADIERSSPGKVAQTQGLKADLLDALGALKSSTVARRGGERALSILPWYMLIGPPGAGKGSLVGKAGLHFLLLDSNQQPRSIQGVGGTRGIEWLLSQEAVLLDMAGRTLGAGGTEGDEDWVAFLQVLRRQRKAKALNGLIVAVPLDQIADAGEAEIKTLARNIRDRLQELIHQLRTVFPVYVVFTKADRIAGFSEFFADLDGAEQARPWGSTLSLERSRGDRAEVLFEEEFAVLTAALSDRRMLRLPGVPDLIQRARVFTFPLQLEAVRDNAHAFIRILFEPDPVQESPFFRGFYFASSGQEGPVIDRVLEPAARSLGIAGPEAPTPAAAPGAFFTQDLFRHVIFADASLATPSTRGKIGQRRRRVILFALLAVLFLTMTIFLGVLNSYNGRLVSETRRAARNVYDRVQTQAPMIENLQSLEALRVRAVQVESFSRSTPFWRWLGGYSGNVLRDPAIRLYCERASTVLVEPAAMAMAQRLAELNETGSGQFLDYYNLYYAWRLLTTSNPKQLVPEDAPILARQMDLALTPVKAVMSPEDRERFPRLVAAQAEFLASHPDIVKRYATGPWTLNDELVARGNARVVQTWESSQFYRAMIQEVRERTQDLPLHKLVAKPDFIRSERPVSGPFTRNAWEHEVRQRIDAHRRRMQRDWVVSEAFGIHPPGLADSLLGFYAADYSREWAAFLDDLNVLPAGNAIAAGTLLHKTARTGSPVLETLRAAAQQTSLGIDPSSPMSQVQRDFQIAGEFFVPEQKASPASKISALYRKLTQKGAGRDALDPTKSWSDRYQTSIERIADWMEKMSKEGASASDIAKGATSGDEQDNPVKYALSQIDELQSAFQGDRGALPVARVLQLPIVAAAGPPCETLKRELSEKWAQLVLQPFLLTLSGKYPFKADGPDATIQDFTEFFRPGGTFWTFYSDNLKSFVAEDGTPVSEQVTQCFTPEFIECLRRAYEIREAFFVGGAQEASLKFLVRTTTPQQQGPPVVVRGISFDVGGQPAQYLMGAPQWKEVKWPGASPELGAALRVQSAPGEPQAEGLPKPGLWGLFRLLDAAQMGLSADGQYPSARWTAGAGVTLITVAYDLQASTGHPFGPAFLRFTVPSGL